MTGLKTNELPKGIDTPGVRAQVKYIRTSAYKAREVLDLIRGKDVERAAEILQFSERDAAQVIRKCLMSAIANAEHNDGIPGDELFVSACYADEGVTIKRWRPRARGRATRIRKRTCHITVIVSRMSETDLERKRAKEATRPGSRAARTRGSQAAEERRRRVARSRRGQAAETHDHDHDHEAPEAPAEEVVEDAAPAETASETPAEAAGAVDQQAVEAEAQADVETEPAVEAGADTAESTAGTDEEVPEKAPDEEEGEK
jgi:large subunit ribosomal protein L22